jgi:small subunit ribosomal protein S1
VIRLQDKGVVADLGDDIEGFVPTSHTAVDDANRLDEYFRPGEPVDLRVLESDAANRRIVLEVTSVPERKARPEPPEPPADAGEEAPDGAGVAVPESEAAPES